MTRKPSKRKSGGARLLPPPHSVALRMYRQGLGDCFLLAFATGDRTQPVYMLIDCGAHTSQSNGRATMADVFTDVIEATGGKLDMLVATHEHTDHLSAFKHEADRLLRNELVIEELWLAWTEDDNDPTARRLRNGRTRAKQAIEKAIVELKRNTQNRANASTARRIDAFDSFLRMDDATGDVPVSGLAKQLGLRNAEKLSGNEVALALLKDRSRRTRYLHPGGQPFDISPNLPARAYVLGPPREEDLLRKSDPSAGRRKETYISGSVGAVSFAASVLAAADETDADLHVREMCFPFDARFRAGNTDAFILQHYGGKEGSHPNWWRQIDDTWLTAAEELALHLDSHTNNTSVVLAFELGMAGRGPVLLFAADAQVGNWLSWRALHWQVAGRKVSLESLLGRTVVYKVGHHASHNATLRQDSDGQPYGLELMRDGFVALVPVDQACAQKLEWNMPHPKLYAALKRKTRGNLLRSDDGHDDTPAVRDRFSRIPGLSGARWRSSRKRKTDGTALYYEVGIRLSE